MLFPFLKNHGVLGLNARNLLYVKPFNPKKAVAFADNKLKTKAFLGARGIPVAKIYGKIENRKQLREFDFSKLPDECALKPNFGSGGEGIVILNGRRDGQFLKKGKEPMSEKELRAHIEDILDGKFSIGGHRDTAFFEQLLKPHSSFARFRPMGLPDIRIIVFNLVPVMAMVRIPTAVSDGKANVHLGGLGIGIDLGKGITTHATQYNKIVKQLPHGESPAGIPIPYWDDLLLIGSKIQQLTNIGYIAIDLTIDEQLGPILLEVNARAGLMVQVANLAPLGARLERIKGLKVTTPEKGVRIGQDLFGTATKKSVATETEPERPILGTHEPILFTGTESSMEVPSRIAPEKERTVFDLGLIEELKKMGLADAQDEKEKTYRIKFTLAGIKVQTSVTAATLGGGERALIGKRDLKNFLIDPSKEKSQKPSAVSTKNMLMSADRLYAQIDRDVLLLKHLKPVNVLEERSRVEEDPLYNPLFQYPTLSFDVQEQRKKLKDPIEDDSPLGILLEKKRKELLLEMDLLEARGDRKLFTELSKKLYGEPSSGMLKRASAFLHNALLHEEEHPTEKVYTSEEALPIFQEILDNYSLHQWSVILRKKLLSDCAVGGNHIYLRIGATFTRSHIDSLIAHEVETHVLTAENGDHQPYLLLRRGTADYLATQEGLAIYNQNLVLPEYHEKRNGPARSALGIQFALNHGFADLRKYLEEELGYAPAKAISKAIEMKRGLQDTSEPGAFTKGIVYMRGQRDIEQFVEDGGDLKRLYIGKVTLSDLELIESIPEIETPLLIPQFMREKSTKKLKKSM